MSTVDLWIAFFGLMLVSIFTRTSLLLVGSKFPIPETVHEFLRYAPTAALIAIVLPEVLFMKDPVTQLFELNLYSPQIFGAIGGVIGFLFTKSILATIFVGMLFFTLARMVM
jgi:branched-subunit amino acid transport protein